MFHKKMDEIYICIMIMCSIYLYNCMLEKNVPTKTCFKDVLLRQNRLGGCHGQSRGPRERWCVCVCVCFVLSLANHSGWVLSSCFEHGVFDSDCSGSSCLANAPICSGKVWDVLTLSQWENGKQWHQ